jgi:hypothetical protein
MNGMGIQPHFTAVRLQLSADEAQQCCFAGAASAHDRNDLSSRESHIHPLQDGTSII